MYAIRSGGKVVGYSDTVVYVRLHENGCYVPCDEAEAGGFCIKTAIDRKDEETGETTTYLEDFVYAFADVGLLGIEPVGSVENVSVKSGTRINWKGALKRAAVDLWDTAENTPEAAPSLWEDVLYKNGARIIPATITAGLAFSKGERGYWGDVLYESLLDNNVWTPEAYPDGWKKVAE